MHWATCNAITMLFLQQTHVFLDNLPRRDFWDYVSIGLTLVLVIIGGITFWEVRRQAIETAKAAKAAADSVREMHQQATILERQTKATEIAARSAESNVALLMSKERARVVVESVKLSFMTNEQRSGPFPKPGDKIVFNMMCYGSTPARILEARTALVLRSWEGPQSEGVPLPSLDISGMLRPDDKGVERSTHIDFEVETALESFNNAESRFRFALDFRSIIRYRDVFQAKASWLAISRYTWMVTLNEEGILGWCEYDHTDTETEELGLPASEEAPS